MTSTTQLNFDPALKQIYRDANLESLTYRLRPLFGLLNKFEGFGGRNMPIVLKYGNPQGRSAVFATAQANRTQVRLEDFLLTRVNDYSVATIDGEVVESTRGDNMAFLSSLKVKIDSAFASLADAIESFLFRVGSGSLSTIGVIAVDAVGAQERITLGQIEEIPNFEVGMTLVASAADGGALRVTPATSAITAIDRSLGTILVGDLTGGTDWAVNDFLYVQGDAAAGGPNVKVSGLNAWLPDAVTAALFFGVDRTIDSRLSGLVQVGTADTLEDTLINAQSRASREEGVPDCFLTSHAQIRRLIKELGAKKEYSEVNAQNAEGMIANIGYRAMVVQGDHGPIFAIAANKCQATRGWMLQKDVWTLNTLGAPTKFLAEDGLRILREANNDGYEVRLGFRGNLSCTAPIWNVNMQLPTP